MTLYHSVSVLEQTRHVQAAISIRRGGVSPPPYHSLNLANHVGDDSEAVRTNRRLFFDQIGLEAHDFIYCHQIHSDRVVVVDSRSAASNKPFAQADAMITAHPSLALGVFTADCVPVFILDVATPVVGIAHAGWRGTFARIAAKTIHAMETHFGTLAAKCLVHLGPSIQKCCYTVSAELADRFEGAFGTGVRFGENKLNLQAANVQQLLQVGVPRHAISVDSFCTACRTDIFYSHRAEGGQTGRMLSFIRLRGD